MRIIKPLFGNAGFYAVVVLLALGGCITDPKMTALEDTLRAYDRAVRWSNFQIIPSFRSKEQADEALALDKLKSIRVTGYTRVQFSVSDTGMSANQVVEIRYYDENVARENVVIDKQHWKYDDESESWVLTSKLPQFMYP